MSWIEKLDILEMTKVVKLPDTEKVEWVKKNKEKIEDRELIFVINSIKSIDTRIKILKELDFDEAFIVLEMMNNEGVGDDYIKNLIKEDYYDDCKVSNLPEGMTVGVELEMVNNYEYHITKRGRTIYEYDITEDGSLETIGGYGIEVVSPILTNENIFSVKDITQLFKKMNFEVNNSCGGHIHIGSKYLDSTQAWKNFFEIAGNCEEILYKITNEENEIPRKKVDYYSNSISHRIEMKNELEYGQYEESLQLSNEQDLDKFISEMKQTIDNKYSSINLLNINNPKKDTIEFRFANGTMNPKIIYENIDLYANIMRVSKELADISKSMDDIEKEKIELKESLKEINDDSEKLEVFMKLIFDNEEQRNIYIRRYESVNDILRLKNKYQNPMSSLKFGKVDFTPISHEEHMTKKWDEFYNEDDER